MNDRCCPHHGRMVDSPFPSCYDGLLRQLASAVGISPHHDITAEVALGRSVIVKVVPR